MYKPNYFCFLLIFLSLLLGCKTKNVKISPINTSAIVPSTKQIENLNDVYNRFNFNWFQAKCKVKIVSGGKQHKLKLHIRIRKDSVIWISIKPSITVIEVARIRITRDSLLFVNFLNDEWYTGSINQLGKKIQFPVTLKLIQSIFLGVPYLLKPFSAYNITQTDKAVILSTSNVEDYKKRRLKQNAILQTFQGLWFNDQKLLRNIAYDVKNKVELDLQYSNFTLLNGDSLAQNILTTINGNKQTSAFIIEYTKLQTDKPFSFPINIPKDYKQIYKLTMPRQQVE